MGVLDDLHRAREDYERRDWVAAYQALSDIDDAALAGDDFSALAAAAHLLGRRNDVVQALQRAYQSYLDQQDLRGAVRAAYWLTATLWSGGEITIGHGWLSRAERLLDDIGEDVVERGYVQERITFGHIMKGEFAEASATAPTIADYGRRFDDPDLVAMGTHVEGRMAVYNGRVAAGMRSLDEAMVAVLAGEVSPIFAGVIYCSSIEACQQISDLGRAGEWTHALSTWCDAQPGLVAFTGQCAVHRGQLMRLHGAFDDAVRELELAAERYALTGGDPAVGQAHYERGDVLRLMGEYDAAGAAFAEAADVGHPAQPGRALLWLERGERDAAVAAIETVLSETPDPVHRSQVLPAAIAVLVAVGDVDAAASLVAELRGIGESFGCTALQAAGEYGAAAVALARGDGDAGLAAARRAADGWARLTAPYDVARARVLVGRALRELGDEHSAVAELAFAREAFAGLGARPAKREVGELLGHSATPGGLSRREVEVLRLVATGRSNPEIAADLVLSEKTVARHLSNIFGKLDVGSRTAAAAFAYEHGLV